MTDEQRRIHLRLISTLPVRSHTWEPSGPKRTIDDDFVLGERLRQLEIAGYNRNEMKAKFGCSCQTIIRHLGLHNKKKGKQ